MRTVRLSVTEPLELLVCLQMVFVRQDTPGTLLRIPFDNKELGNNFATSQHLKSIEARAYLGGFGIHKTTRREPPAAT